MASIVVVAGRWEAITPEVRFVGLVASLLAVYFTAETLRRRLTTTATALAVLSAAITAPVGIAAAATLEQTWPVCVLVGGVLALVASEVQSRRWSLPVLKAATVIAVGLGATGLAALTDTPVAVIGALTAAVACAVGAEKRSVVLGTAASFMPFLVLLADAGVGAGTLERIGATGPSLSWSAPLASLIGAIVIAISAHRRSDVALAGLAAAALLVGALLGLYRLESPAVIWWSLPALLALVLLATERLTRHTVWKQAAGLAIPALIVPLALAATISPVIVLGARMLNELSGVGRDTTWALPLALTTIALFTSAVRVEQSPRARGALFGAGCLAACAATLSSGAALYGWDDVAMLWTITALTGYVGLRASGRGDRWFHAGAVLAVVSVAASMAVGGLSTDAAALALVAFATAATGVAFLYSRVTPVDTTAVVASVFALVVAVESAPYVQSIVVATVAAQFSIYSLARNQRNLATLGGAVSAIAAASLWWTSGTNDAAIAWLEPHGADGSDLAITVASLALMLAGMLLRRMRPAGMAVSSWLAYSPGLAMAATWLLMAQIDVDGTWPTVSGLTVGLVAVGVGGWRHLAAPLVLGTALIGGSVVVSAGPRLAEAPTWIWIAAGGVIMLALAALIERSDRRLLFSDPEAGEPSLAQQFFRGFE